MVSLGQKCGDSLAGLLWLGSHALADGAGAARGRRSQGLWQHLSLRPSQDLSMWVFHWCFGLPLSAAASGSLCAAQSFKDKWPKRELAGGCVSFPNSVLGVPQHRFCCTPLARSKSLRADHSRDAH